MTQDVGQARVPRKDKQELLVPVSHCGIDTGQDNRQQDKQWHIMEAGGERIGTPGEWDSLVFPRNTRPQINLGMFSIPHSP